MAYGYGTNGTRAYGTNEPRGWKHTASRYALLPLRLFLGVTFVYAGLDKLTDSAFLTSGEGPGTIGSLMNQWRDTAALPWLVDLGLNAPVGFGYAIAIGELLVGIGTLLGLFTRVAAVGGALLSLTLWLTVSWSVTPYYYGNDLPYLMAWLPLVLAGASPSVNGGASVDAMRALRRRRML
ncbi:DoxX family protein [Streptomyces sp. NBC_00237]|uniref:DoxX family protein n=1 Tax=Streptomyces sp. NBC_00237 TaxID=2975687 RepID=UPI002256140B|nr:DoxX family protein [Streptomyces sp. NBC_00237]MCX5204745.1 DoxX family protein [Streptomyces sp. NBC_00237]